MMTSTTSNNAQMLQETIQQLLQKHNVSFEHGLTSDEVRSRRDVVGGYYNTVAPPIQCPAWICCLLPCIKHIPSMKHFSQIIPEDTQVRRNYGQYIRYDATALVVGDIIRIEEGDTIPADCIVLQLETDELLVDHKYITGDDKPVSLTKCKYASSSDGSTNNSTLFNVNAITTFYWGGRVVLGSGIALCIAVGPNTFVSRLIQSKCFPPSNHSHNNTVSPNDTNNFEEEMVHLNKNNHTMDTVEVDIESNRAGCGGDENVVGIALLRQSSRDGSSRM